MKIFGMKFAGAFAACLMGVLMLGNPSPMLAQATAAAGTGSIHGHVTNPAGEAITTGEVRLTTNRSPGAVHRKFDYTFPIDSKGDYKGTDIKPGNYLAMVYQGSESIDFLDAPIVAGQDKQLDFDMTRAAYISKMGAADLAALEAYKKKHAEIMAANAKVADLNALLKTARADTKAGNFGPAVQAMTQATTAKPDEPILWETLGDAQLGEANAAAEAARASKATDASVPGKYAAAETSYQKALSLNAASSKPNAEIEATADNQLGETLGKQGKAKEAAAAYEAAAKADPTKAGMYFFNEAVTLFNAGDGDGAAAAADKAIAADPNKADAYYIKGQALVAKATVDPKTNKITVPPGCVEAYQKYLELAPTGPRADEVKGILAGIGQPVTENYKAGKSRKKK